MTKQNEINYSHENSTSAWQFFLSYFYSQLIRIIVEFLCCIKGLSPYWFLFKKAITACRLWLKFSYNTMTIYFKCIKFQFNISWKLNKRHMIVPTQNLLSETCLKNKGTNDEVPPFWQYIVFSLPSCFQVNYVFGSCCLLHVKSHYYTCYKIKWIFYYYLFYKIKIIRRGGSLIVLFQNHDMSPTLIIVIVFIDYRCLIKKT